MMNLEHREVPIGFEVTSARTQDAERLEHIQRESWMATYPNDDISLTKEDLKKKFDNTERRVLRWKDRLETPQEGSQVFVVKERDLIVGFCIVQKGDVANHVDALYLDPEFRGQHAGSTIFKESLKWLGQEKPVELEVASYNDRAIEFYKRFGFEDVGIGAPHFVVDDKFLPITNMRKPAAT